jgi:hypothetical protein
MKVGEVPTARVKGRIKTLLGMRGKWKVGRNL